jgi:protease PrsW
MLINASIALAPVVLVLAGLVRFDAYKLVSFNRILLLMAAGALAAAASYLVNNYVYARFPGDLAAYSRDVSPWIEEGFKALLLVYLIRTRRVGLPVDGGISGFAIGTGFALVENLYFLARPHAALPVQVIRGFGTAIMHGGTGTLLAMISITLYERRPNAGLYLLLPGFLAAVALHSGFNQLLARPAVATLAMLVVLPAVIYLVFRHSERTLRAWLDTDLDANVRTLESIQAGKFLETPSGRYLEALRDRFRGEKLVDMLCCLRLHSELAVRAKGVLLLRESGLAEPSLDEETRDKLAEFAQLKRSIGMAGLLELRPLMMGSGKDIWELTLLKG